MKKLFKKKLNYGIVMAIASSTIIVGIAFIKPTSLETNSVVTKNKVLPPLKNVDIHFENYSVDANRSSKIKYFETGSVISIPASAFVDSVGKIINGKIDIKYRELHDAVDFFVSGIPMTYDSAGMQYHFESAGMLEIQAYQHGKPVFVNPERKIIVEMASKQEEDKFNIYKYYPLTGNWKYVYKDNVVILRRDKKHPDKKTIPNAVDNVLAKNNLANDSDLLIPEKSNRESFQFDVEIDSAEFPEMSVYKGLLFEVDKEEKDFNPTYASSTWNDISLNKGQQKGSYLMTLSKARESHTFETMPVFDEKNYDEALTFYKKMHAKRQENEAKIQKSRDSIYGVLNRERLDQNEFAKNTSQRELASVETQDFVKRIFVISGFGIWNSDCPEKLPKGEQFAATYTDTLGNKLTFKTLYLVEKGRNAMFSIASYSRLYYDPTKKNTLWAVTTDNKLAVFKEDDFEKIKIKDDSYTLKMNVINKPVTKAYEVRSILKI